MEVKPVFYSTHYCKFLVPGANANGNDQPSQERQAYHATYWYSGWHLGYATTTTVTNHLKSAVSRAAPQLCRSCECDECNLQLSLVHVICSRFLLNIPACLCFRTLQRQALVESPDKLSSLHNGGSRPNTY